MTTRPIYKQRKKNVQMCVLRVYGVTCLFNSYTRTYVFSKRSLVCFRSKLYFLILFFPQISNITKLLRICNQTVLRNWTKFNLHMLSVWISAVILRLPIYSDCVGIIQHLLNVIHRCIQSLRLFDNPEYFFSVIL